MRFFSLPRQVQLAAWLGLAFALWITWDLSHWWSLKDDYSFGYIVPIFVAYVLYDRWPRILALFTGPGAARGHPARWLSVLALLGLVWGCFTFFMGALYRAVTGPSLPGSFVMTVSFSWLVLCGALYFGDRTADGTPLTLRQRLGFTGLLLFPALVWIISAPLMSAVETAVATFLLNRVTTVVFLVFHSLGFALERQGSVLVLPRGEVGVEEACSGIRSLTACLFSGSFLAAVFLDRFWKKAVLVAMALILAVFTNLLRSLFLTAWAYAYGAEAIEGAVHDITGYAVLGLTIVLLLCLLPLMNLRIPDLELEGGGKAASDAPFASEEEEVTQEDSDG